MPRCQPQVSETDLLHKGLVLACLHEHFGTAAKFHLEAMLVEGVPALGQPRIAQQRLTERIWLARVGHEQH